MIYSRLTVLIVLPALFVLICLAATFANFLFKPIEDFATRLARRKLLSIWLIAGAAVAIRISLLPFLPLPVPEVHDEFSYLLAADTFAHGRLANPPHPMWIYFDTFHVNQHPMYMSKYPPAQGVVLAVGQLLGHPWIGVLLSVAAMCGAIVWALQGWLPPQWAFLGGLLVVLHLGVSTYWINGYWGGAVAAIGGALVVGALPRIMRLHRPRDAAMFGLGAAILANSRPFEGLVLCFTAGLALLIWLGGRRRPSWRETVGRVVVPLLAVVVPALVFMGYYNWRGTGHPLLFPYVVYSRTAINPADFSWQKDKPPAHYLNPQFDAFYNGWSREVQMPGKADSIPRVWHALVSDTDVFAQFFLWPELCVPFLALVWVLADRRVRFLVFQFVFCFLGFLLVVWFQAHYAAPLTATAFALVVQCLRHLRRWRFYRWPLGVALTRAVVLVAVLTAPFHTYYTNLQPAMRNRAELAKKLNSLPGDKLVIVRYSNAHNPHQEWVYNRADIDHAKIVWAREIPGISMQPLLNYFRGRKVWLVQVP